MKGDFTRFTHRVAQHYSAVLRQQGRVDLDADWNEAVAIAEHAGRALVTDAIGVSGVPHAGGGFEIGATPDGGLSISAGRMWVNGILCELVEPARYDAQPMLPQPEPLTEGDADVDGRTDLVYLDVWQRHVTAVEDPEMLDPALDGLDTTTRVQTVCQVRVLKDVGAVDSCAAVAAFPPAPSGARITNSAVAVAEDTDECDVVPAGGYRGVENRLYRVEIHDGGGIGAATWKWSRDNGSVLFGIEELFDSPANRIRLRSLGRDRVLTLRQDDWIEIIDDASELGLGPGFMARVESVNAGTRIVTLDRDVPVDTFDTGRRARARRWDHLAGDAGVLDADGGATDLEDGIRIELAGDDFQTGDYWTFAARAAGGTIETLAGDAPHGIAHHYAPLALVRWADDGDGGVTASVMADCRPAFPPLTDIGADDVRYDNGACEMPGVETVQDALDALCRSRDLRFHNRHLHGTGIVCGLKVVCGPDGLQGERRNVTLRTGYAIDCEGNDIVVERESTLDLVARIEALDEERGNDRILDGEGNGEVCLVLDTAQDGVPVRVEPFGPQQSFMERVLAGTMIRDFYDRCIRRIVDFVRGEFTAGPDEADQLVGPTQRRLTTFLNLIIQFVNPANGRFVYLSEREDRILRDLYQRLRALLRSETFCAMFANARPFPDYPFRDARVNTIFGRGFHTRVRVDPALGRAYTMGAGESVHVFDLETEEMIASLSFPGGAGVRVRDVAFSPDGRQLYGVGTLNDDTMFAVADVDGERYTFRAATVVCELELVTLATTPERGSVYAVGRGTGLYEINPESVPDRLQPVHAFNASGHLVLHGSSAYATARAAGAAPDAYDHVRRFALGGGAETTFMLRSDAGAPRTGSDDIAVVRLDANGGDRLCIVADGPGQKQIVTFDANATGAQAQQLGALSVEDTGIRLAAVDGLLAVAFEDSYQLGLVDARRPERVMVPDSNAAFRHPLQISPVALAHDARRERVYALNYMSNTITRVDAAQLRPAMQFDLLSLAAYRDGVINAFLDLAGGFLQYLKDCFCDRFLVRCPECEGDERIDLACVSIRNGSIYQVCNFSRRRYVKSFPAVEYWLSLVPVIPLVREAVAKFCCTVLPDLFGRMTAPVGAMSANMAVQDNRVRSAQMRQGVGFMQQLDVAALWRNVGSSATVARTLTADWLAARPAAVAPQVAQPATPRLNQVVGQRVELAREELLRAGVEVAAVEAYDPGRGAENLVAFAKTGGRVPTGRPIRLYEEDGIVKYYSVADTPVTAATGAAATAETARLTSEMERITSVLGDLTAARDALTATQAEVAMLRTQLEQTRTKSEADLAARDRQIAELRTATESVRAETRAIEALRGDVDRLLRRPGGGGQ